MTPPTVTVIVPTHLPEPDAMGKVSLAQTLSVLHRHIITFVVPIGLDVRWYEEFCRGKAQVRFERFDWHGFDARSGRFRALGQPPDGPIGGPGVDSFRTPGAPDHGTPDGTKGRAALWPRPLSALPSVPAFGSAPARTSTRSGGCFS